MQIVKRYIRLFKEKEREGETGKRECISEQERKMRKQRIVELFL